MKVEMIETTVHILGMFNFFHSGNNFEQNPGAWTQLTVVPIKHVKF